MFVALYSIPLVFSLLGTVVLDNDLWWHLRTGQWVLAHHAVPATDPFSTPGAGKPWAAYSWLFEIALYGIFQAFGLTGIVVLVGASSLAIAAALHRLILRFQLPFAVTFLLCAIGFVALSPMYTPRPWLLTLLFFTIEIIILVSWYGGHRHSLFWLPLIFTLWANIHIQFVYGLFLLGVAALSNLLVGYRAAPIEAPPPFRNSRELIVTTVASALATLLNPYGVGVYFVIWQYASQWVPFALVQELKAATFRSAPEWLLLFTAMAAAYLLGFRKEKWPLPYLLLAAGAAISFRATRDLWFLLLIALPVIAWELSKLPWKRRERPPRWYAIPVAVCIVLIGCAVVRLRHLDQAHLDKLLAERYPVAAAEFVADHHLRGPLFNDFDWGGYLIWRLPELPVSMDGRTNVYGNDELRRHYATWTGAPSWKSDPGLASANVVIANVNLPLTSLLESDVRFREVYRDHVAAVFVAAR